MLADRPKAIPLLLVLEGSGETRLWTDDGREEIVTWTAGDLLSVVREIQQARELTLVHPFDDPLVIAGAGTVADEILDDMPDVDAICFGIGTVLTKRDALHGDPTINAAWQLLTGTLPIVAVWLAFAPHAYFRPDQTRGLVSLVCLILGSNALAYYCWFRLIRALPASVASLTTLVVPCVGFGSSALLIGGHVTWLDGAALALIVAAVGLVLVKPAKG